MKRVVLCGSLLLAFGGWDWLTSPDPNVEAGNLAFDGAEFGQALALYERSEESAGSSEAIRFDIGAALYKMALAEDDPDRKLAALERAETAFREASASQDLPLKSAALHNLGNSMFQRERWQEAADSYKKALKANQDNDDARYNLELVLRQQNEEKENQTGDKGSTQPKDPGQGQDRKPQGQDGGDQNSDDEGDSPNQRDQGAGDSSQAPSGSGDDADPPPTPGSGNQAGDPSAGSAAPPPTPGSGAPQNQPQGGPGQPLPTAPGSGSDPRDGEAEGDVAPEGESKSDRDRKLDRLEDRSRDLRRERLHRGGASNRTDRMNPPKDW